MSRYLVICLLNFFTFIVMFFKSLCFDYYRYFLRHWHFVKIIFTGVHLNKKFLHNCFLIRAIFVLSLVFEFYVINLTFNAVILVAHYFKALV